MHVLMYTDSPKPRLSASDFVSDFSPMLYNYETGKIWTDGKPGFESMYCQLQLAT